MKRIFRRRTLIESCESFWSQRQYLYNLRDPIGQEEGFPIAYSILVYHNFNQLEQLLSAIYRPQNYYCFHVDRKSPKSFHIKVQSLAKCFPGNVILTTESKNVKRCKPTLLAAEFQCMRELRRLSTKWRYLINLTGEEFPLVTNMELVTLLSKLQGLNLLGYSKPKDMWKRIPIELPYGMERYKSSTHYAFTYKAIEYIVTSHLSLAVLDFMKKFRCNDEHYFAVLHYNYNITRLPGSEWVMDPKKSVANQFELRYKNWKFGSNFECKSRRIKREICMIGVKTLPELVNTYYGTALFANKFLWDFQPRAWDCMYAWHYRRQQDEYFTGRVSNSFAIKIEENHDHIIDTIRDHS
ncbi:beta-1,3-galactosyl-O-glycosyl-glycoprotein beta-1,6-N-acetylglucosaminyltransferase-like isoform X2 [Convolutriloba macropyga]|uniref:beta-1,3-galactosyl-O-glycosyl-glycoprotein beta-1,6-N-acetylglucosaminyltransferase-like isoform X2 n=1 Tax=Convolutriloba macropyga TaxID=536237 RepID=UPI003F52424F